MLLDIRLKTAAEMVPVGARLADVGSDHAYLPISLCLENKIECALASDINEGPVSAAIKNIKKNGLESKIRAAKADGLALAKDFSPDCITVLGMGGELIVSILDEADFIKDERITLVLQPMTHPEILANYLADNGFSVVDEKIVRDGGRDDRIYRIIKARYTKTREELSPAEAYVGKINLSRLDEATVSYIERLIRVTNVIIEGKEVAGADAENEKKLLSELKGYIKSI